MINKKNFPKDAIRIELPYEEFRKYIQQYPKIIKFIEKELQKEYSYTYDPTRKNSQEIYLKYRPYKNYDYFSFAYYPRANPDPSYSGKASYLRFKINNEVESEYSTHLWEEYWDYNERYTKNRNATSITTGSTKSERSANSSAISTYSGIMANLERKRA
jgi:hypothetical protein